MDTVSKRILFCLLALAPLCAAHAEDADPPLQLKRSGFLEAGITQSSLTAGYGNWKGQFVRGMWQSDENNVWNVEIAHLEEFGNSGVLFVLGDSHTINPEWFVNAYVSTSSGGELFLPQLRLDVSINRKWLEKLNLVTTLGFTAINAKDGHEDRSVLLGASYYFEQPWVIEGGVRFNNSNPGSVSSTSEYFAVTYGRDKERYISLMYGYGGEAYQNIGENAIISDFLSNVWTLTWRQWVDRDYGFQLRAVSYHNPHYDRAGAEIAVFRDF